MTATEIRAEHTTLVDAPASTVYGLITQVAHWPVLFGPTVHTQVLERSRQGDRFQIWALVSGAVNSWRSRRYFDPVARRVSFRQDHENPLFGLMRGGWTCGERPDGTTKVVLEHRFTPPPDQVDARERIERDLDRNGTAELEALRTVAALPGGPARWMLTFSESLDLAGNSEAAREFVWDAERWPERLPHVAGLELAEPSDRTQDMTMSTRAPDGSVHTTRSIRVLLDDGSVVYKQTRPPRVLLGHSGRWEFPTGPAGAAIRSTHTVLLDPAGVAEVYGPSASPEEAVDRVRTALTANSRVTMEHAARYDASIGAAR